MLKSKLIIGSVTICLLIFIFVSAGLSPLSFAETQIVICPTPLTKASGSVQLLTCNIINQQPAATGILPFLNFLLPNAQPVQAGPTCQPDTPVAAACTCPKHEEEDVICTDSACTADGGQAIGQADLDTTAGLPAGSNCVFNPQGNHVRHVTSSGAVLPVGNSSASTSTTTTGASNATSCVYECNSKPVIYLYPTSTELINVSITLQGQITASIPNYPQNGWTNILAQPDGTLTSNGQTYHELYYESDTIKATPLQEGVFIPTSKLTPELTTLTSQLGLNSSEQSEFIAYWVPRLKGLDAPYIFFTIFSPAEKARVDDVHISPKPDTFINFLAYFKPVTKPYAVKSLQLPKPPVRAGFTAVEWGGTIDTN